MLDFAWKYEQSGYLTRSDTKQAVQLHKRAKGLKFCLKVEEELYYLICENKGADQLCSYYKANLNLWFAFAKFWFSDAAALICNKTQQNGNCCITNAGFLMQRLQYAMKHSGTEIMSYI